MMNSMGSENDADGSEKAEPSYFFLNDSFIAIEELLESSPDLADSFEELSAQEREKLLESIALFNDALSTAFIDIITTSEE